MTTAADILTKARDLIEDRTHWCTAHLARDVEGNPVPPCDPKAVCWCASGALIKAASDFGLTEDDEEFDIASETLSIEAFCTWGVNTVEVNDTTDHADVLDLFKHAIEEAHAA